MDTKAIIREVELTYQKVKSLAGWAVDQKVVLAITTYYVTSDQEFDSVRLNRALDELKSKAGWFSPLRGNLLPIMAAFLDKSEANIQEEVDKLFRKQVALREVGFRNTIHSYLAALLLSDEEEIYKEEAKAAKRLYDAMKKQHYFLTSDDDYSYAVLLGRKSMDPIQHARSMRIYYDALRAQSFRTGNELQWLSQIMTYIEQDFDPLLVSRATEILGVFKQQTKVQPSHYPMIGFLTVFHVGNEDLQQIMTLTDALEKTKAFKWNREMALSLAIGYVTHELTKSAAEMSVSLATSVEMILQAQQAVMAATTAAVAAASASSTSSH